MWSSRRQPGNILFQFFPLYIPDQLVRATEHLWNVNCFMNSCFVPKVNRLDIENRLLVWGLLIAEHLDFPRRKAIHVSVFMYSKQESVRAFPRQ